MLSHNIYIPRCYPLTIMYMCIARKNKAICSQNRLIKKKHRKLTETQVYSIRGRHTPGQYIHALWNFKIVYIYLGRSMYDSVVRENDGRASALGNRKFTAVETARRAVVQSITHADGIF